MIRLISIVLTGLVLGTLFSGPISPAMGAEKKKPAKCVTLRKKVNGREVAINTCDVCQIVRVSRQRPTSGAPSFRTLMVQKKSAVDLPFRGPGRTRLVGADPCKG